jgi:hypothetical protein
MTSHENPAPGGLAMARGARGLLLTVRFGAALTALLVAAVVVATASRGAFTATTENAENSWATGSVIITDDDDGVAMFAATGLAGGSEVENCITVTYEGTLVPANVRLYGSAAGDLAEFLDLKIDIGTGGEFGDCTGFTSASTLFDGTLESFAANRTDFASGLAGWSPAATDESRTYRFTVTVQDTNDAQGLSATATFTWEAQNQ